MIILDIYAHITFRGKVSCLLLFLLCWYCSPSVLCLSVFFAVIALFSKHSDITCFSLTMVVFFLFLWFSTLLSLLPIMVYVTVDFYQGHQRRLVQRANSMHSAANPHYGGRGIHAVPIITQVAPPSSDASTAAPNSFATFTSGSAMLTARSVFVRDAPLFRHSRQVRDDYLQRRNSRLSSTSNGPVPRISFSDIVSPDEFFRGVAAFSAHVDSLKYRKRSPDVSDLVSQLSTLSITASPLEHASLVPAQPIGDGFFDGSGDRSSFVSCHCGGNGHTSSGSCSCLDHACSGTGCACMVCGSGSRGLDLPSENSYPRVSEHISGPVRGATSFGSWFSEIMEELQECLSRLQLGGGNDNDHADVPGSSPASIRYNGGASLNHNERSSWNFSGLGSLVPSNLHVSEVLTSMVTRRLSIVDDQASNGGNDDGDGSDVEISRSPKGDMTGVQVPCILGDNNSEFHQGGSRIGDVDSSSEYSYYSGSNSNGSTTSHGGQEAQHGVYSGSEYGGSVWSGHSSLDGGRLSDGYEVDAWQPSSPSPSSVASPAQSVSGYDYEESYNPFNSDDDNSSVGTVPLYTGTAVFNDESAFGNFDV